MNLRKIFKLFGIILLIPIICLATETEEIDYAEYNLNYDSRDEAGNLKIYSDAAILIESTTGKVLMEKNSTKKEYPASTTKILTAILTIENCDMDEIVTASEFAVNSVEEGYSKADIQVGESFTVKQVLEVMMLHSANEAATMLAEHISGSQEAFAELMNQKAKELGCQNSNFVNANGMHNENHYSTAYDMALIAKYCMEDETFRELVLLDECSLPTTELWQEERTFSNTNSMMIETHKYYYKYCNGIKTGFTTPAKNCLISSANKDGFELIAVVLHAEATDEGLSARYLDTINLLNYGFNNFNLENIQSEYGITEATRRRSWNKNEISSNTNIEENEEITAETSTSLSNEFKFDKDITMLIAGISILIIVCLIKIVFIFKSKKGKHSKF